MKVSEFEAKLATVSDDKLRQMLAASRRDGPEIAVAMLLAECGRRGMDGLDAPDASSSSGAGAESHSVHSGHDFAPEDSPSAPGDEIMDAPPATAPDWLNEESKTGLSGAMKVLLVLVVIGGIAGAAWMFTR